MSANRKTLLVAAIIIALIGSNLFFYFKNYDAEKEVVDAQQTNKYYDDKQDSIEFNADFLDLQTQFNASLARLDDISTAVGNKDREIANLKAQIAVILKNKNATEKQLKQAKDLLASLNNKISTLEKENEALHHSSKQLAKERDAALTENKKLGSLIEKGKILVASHIRIIPIELRKGGRVERSTAKVKNADLLRFLFDVDQNSFAQTGNYTFQLRITNPEGKLMSNPAVGSGTFKTVEGDIKNFSIERTVALSSGARLTDIAIDWQQTDTYAKGNYQVEIYCKGYKIGSGTTELK